MLNTCQRRAGRQHPEADPQGPELDRLRRRRLAGSATSSPTRPAPRSRSSEIPSDLQYATVAIEDERFYDHDGVDFEGVTRAAVENLDAGEVKQGGSTITMQLVRNLYIDDPERDLERKIKEAKHGRATTRRSTPRSRSSSST